MVQLAHADQSKKAEVITKATLRAQQILGLSQAELAEIIGVSAATISRSASGQSLLPLDGKKGEHALMFLRIFRSLDALMGGNETQARDWFRTDNAHLQGVPAERVLNITGLVHVAEYLDAMRGKL